jgi:hypothetical protein
VHTILLNHYYDLMEQSYGTIDAEVEFSKKALAMFYDFKNMKKAKTAMCKNNYKKLEPFLLNEDIIYKSLVYAIHFSYNKIINKIVKNFYQNRKFDINKNHSEIFKFAIFYKKNHLVITLIELGANVHADNDWALIHYGLLDDMNMVDFLIKNSADVFARNSLALIQAAGNGFIGMVGLLLAHMKNIKIETLKDFNATNYDLALLSAAFGKHNDTAILLLKNGANPSVNDSEVLVIAVDTYNSILVDLVLAHGANPNVNNGMILEKAIRNGNTEIVKILIGYKVNGEYICDIGVDNSSALRWACLKGNDYIVKMLLDSKMADGKPRCDVNALNNEAYHLATGHGHTAVVKLLEEYGGNI